MWNYLKPLRQQAITSVLHGWNSTKQSKSYGKQNYILRRITFAKFFKAFLQIKSSSIKLSRTFMSCQMLTEKWMLRVPKICQFICMLLYVRMYTCIKFFKKNLDIVDPLEKLYPPKSNKNIENGYLLFFNMHAWWCKVVHKW